MPSNHLILCSPLCLLPSSFPAPGSFQMSHFFTSGGQSIGVSASASVLSMNIQDWFPLGWTLWISLQSKGFSRVLQLNNRKIRSPHLKWAKDLNRHFSKENTQRTWKVLSWIIQFSSVQFTHSVMSSSLWSHEPQHTRLPCPSPTPGVYPNSCPLGWWCHPTISSSVVPFSPCPRSFPASGAFQMSQFFTTGGQSIGVSALASVPPMNTQDWFPLGLTGWISLQFKGLSRVFSNTTVQNHQFFGTQHF